MVGNVICIIMLYLKGLTAYFLEMYTKVCMGQGDMWDLFLKYFSKRRKEK